MKFVGQMELKFPPICFGFGLLPLKNTSTMYLPKGTLIKI